MRKNTTTIRLEKNTKAQFEKLGEMRDSSDDVMRKLLGETWYLPKLKDTLAEANELNEKGKKHAGSPLNTQACDLLIKVLTEFVTAIEAR